MLMVIDIGNTNTVVGLFYKEEFVQNWRLNTDPRRTDDEYASILRSLFRDSGVTLASIEQIIISSVVPTLNEVFVNMVYKMTGREALVLGPNLYHKLPIKVPDTAVHEIGADIFCSALAAWERYKKSCIVLDFGTALTFTALDNTGLIRGVAITPGLGTAIKALSRDTALLPSVALEAPPSSLGTNTLHAIQSGVVLGYKGLIENLVNQMKSELQTQNKSQKIPVITTGGLSYVLEDISDIFDASDAMLTLKGLVLVSKFL